MQFQSAPSSFAFLLFTALLCSSASAAPRAQASDCLRTASEPIGYGSFRRPFAATSPWNARPDQPVLGEATIPTSLYYPSVSAGSHSTGAFKAKETDPPVTINGVDARGIWDPDSEAYKPSITIPRWPAGVVPASGSDGHAEIVDPIAGIVHSFTRLKQVDGRWTATQYAWTALKGRGMGDPAHYFQGARAAGVAPLGGLIRTHEIDDGDTLYRHALAMSLTYNGLSAAPSYRFPATSADSDAATANIGAIPMGSLMMLPADFDAYSLATPALRKIAETLKVHGAYVVDRNYGTPFVIYVESGSNFSLHQGGWNGAAAADLQRLRAALRPLESSTGWIDGDGLAFDPQAPMNILSMRGYWYRTKGTQSGVYDTWRQAVVFPPTTLPIEQVNAGGRAYSGVEWSRPALGTPYRLSVQATGGARLRVTITDKATSSLVFDSGVLADTQTLDFIWPAQDFKLATTAYSGTAGVESTVRADLVAVTATPAPACR
jgi:hypothetical protein